MNLGEEAKEINQLWTTCIQLQWDTGFSSALNELAEAMDKKTSWDGGDEIRLMFAVKEYLRHWRA